MDNRKKDLVRNTTILMVGNFSSKFLTFILVPLYTIYFSPEEFGEIDLYITLLSMLYILVSLQSIESSFRFIQDNKTEQNKITTLSNATFTSIFGITIFVFIMTVYGLITDFPYTLIFILYISSTIFVNLFLHTLRGMNKTTTYMILSIIATVISLVGNLVLILVFKFGAIVLLVTPIIVNTILILIILKKEHLLSYIKFSALDKNVLKDQLRFSIPLIPNAISIWLLNSIGRFVLLFYYGTSAVGILAFSLRFPMLLSTLSSVFHMAWQVSSISQYNDKDKNNFASEIFEKFSVLLLSSLLIILPTVKIVMFTIIGEDYLKAWLYIPIFFLGVVFKAFSQFYSVGFFGAKKTNVIFYGSLIGAFFYLVMSFLLAERFYILGIAIAYSFSELISWIYIAITVTPHLKIKINVKKYIFTILMLFICFICYYALSWEKQFFIVMGALLIFVYLNSYFMKNLFKRFY